MGRGERAAAVPRRGDRGRDVAHEPSRGLGDAQAQRGRDGRADHSGHRHRHGRGVDRDSSRSWRGAGHRARRRRAPRARHGRRRPTTPARRAAAPSTTWATRSSVPPARCADRSSSAPRTCWRRTRRTSGSPTATSRWPARRGRASRSRTSPPRRSARPARSPPRAAPCRSRYPSTTTRCAARYFRHFNAPTFHVHLAEVEVDPRTGRVTILRYVVAQDVGRAINPTGIEGQIHGGVAQGIGYALFEDIHLEDGRVLENDLESYRLPGALDIPPIETILLEHPDPARPVRCQGRGRAADRPGRGRRSPTPSATRSAARSTACRSPRSTCSRRCATDRTRGPCRQSD